MASNGIRDRVAIVGMGCTPFGEHWDKSASDLLVDAGTDAYQSAQVDPEQVLVRLRTHSPFEAVDAPRLHCTPEGKVSLEASRFRDDIPKALKRHGFEVDERDPYSFYLGCVQLVLRDKRGFVGVADPRRDGSAGGPG